MSGLVVHCHAGYRGEERPLAFTLGGRRLEVRDIQDRWYSPGAVYFRVLADDGNLYLLRHDEDAGEWSLEGFRAQK